MMAILTIKPVPAEGEEVVSYDFEITNGKVTVERYVDPHGNPTSRAVLSGKFLTLEDSDFFWSVLPGEAICDYVFNQYSGIGFNAGTEGAIKYVIKNIPTPAVVE